MEDPNQLQQVNSKKEYKNLVILYTRIIIFLSLFIFITGFLIYYLSKEIIKI